MRFTPFLYVMTLICGFVGLYFNVQRYPDTKLVTALGFIMYVIMITALFIVEEFRAHKKEDKK